MAEWMPEWAKWMGPETTPQGTKAVAAKGGGLLDTVGKAATQGKDVVLRNMKQVGPAMKEVFGERIYPQGLPAPETAAKTAAKGSPFAGLLAAYEGGSELVDAFDPRKIPAGVADLRAKFASPEEKAKGQAYGEGVANQAVQAGVTAMQKGALLGKAIETEKNAAVVEAAPPQFEAQRQTLENGAKEQLRTNQLSRPKAAEAVVKADAARQGVELKPEEMKVKVAEETAAMKGMDNEQLSKYLSYALIAGGLIASFTDKSGKTGQIFADSMNRQLDRKQQMDMYKEQQKAKAEAAQAAAKLEDRKLDIQEADVGSKIEGRQQTADMNRERMELAREELSAKVGNWERNASIAQAKLDAYKDRTLKGADGKGGTGPYLTQKENLVLVDSAAEEMGIEVSDAAKQAAAQKLAAIQKSNPEMPFDQQMGEVFKDFEATSGEPSGLPFGIFDKEPGFILKK